jgi:enamine deaminase RidA (YjgF/YER057c/UK114 family)
MSVEVIKPSGVHATETYAHAVKVGNTVYISGQIAFDMQGNLVGKGDVEAQAMQVYENLKAVLASVGATYANVVKMVSYVRNLEDWPRIMAVRHRYVDTPTFVATLIVVPGLANPDFLLEVEAVAVIGEAAGN